MYSDFLMGLIALFFAYTLFQKGKSSPNHSRTFIYSWSIAMLLLAIGVFLGGIVEGLKPTYSDPKGSLRTLRIFLALATGMACSVQVFGVLHLTFKDSLLRSLLLGVWGAGSTIYVVLLFVFDAPGFKTPFIVFNTLATISLFAFYFLQNQTHVSRAIMIGIAFQTLAILCFFNGWNIAGVLSASVLFDLALMIGLFFYYRGIMAGQLWSFESYTPALVV